MPALPRPLANPTDAQPEAAEGASQREPLRLVAARRPRLLISAARHGLADYRRERDLPRLLRGVGGDAVAALEDLEAAAEAQRRGGDPAWSCMRHVELMIALMAERALRGQ